MYITTSIEKISQICSDWRAQGLTIGLVPTMGYLHRGHLSLVEAAAKENDKVVMSIFVNPTQFGPNEDFSRYPRDMGADLKEAYQAGVDVAFCPNVEEMYPAGYQNYVEPGPLTTYLCGKSRPGHFRGVCTVVLKFFNIVTPNNAYFGQKDYQQFVVLKQMIKDFNLPITMHCMPIIRESDNLALSSRNVYLTAEQRQAAPMLFAALSEAKQMYAAGENNAAIIEQRISEIISGFPGARIDYIAIADKDTLEPLTDIENGAVIALAVWFGNTRLIDNILI